MRKHWFFDLDGTLADTERDIVFAWKESLRRLGRSLENFDRLFKIGPPLEKVVYELYDDATPELVADMMNLFKPLYDDGGFPNTMPYAGVPELLAELKSNGAKIYIVTNKRHLPTQRIARKFGWNELFDGIWSYDSLAEKHKKPELLAILLKELSVAADDAVMVGDTFGDVDSGKTNGLATIGVTWGYGTREEVASADAVFDSPFEVAQNLRK